LREPLRFSFHHVWNYVFILLAVGGLALWRFEGIDGRLGFGAVAAWVVLGRAFMPWIINEHIGFMNRWVFNDYKKAHKRYRQAVNSSRATANGYCALGSLTYAEGDIHEAVRLLEEASNRLPVDIPVRVLLARALMRAGRVDEAFDVAHHCLCISDTNPMSHMIIGDVLKEKQDLTAAASAYQRALDLVSPIFHCHLSLGEIYMQLGEDGEAAREFDRAVQLAPENPDGLYWQGMVMWSRGNLSKAREFLQTALERRPIGDYTYQVPYKEIVAALSGVNDAL
jgi:tetratricopeptide (TPR) repeat protein